MYMEIYWLGHGCFRLKGRDATVITDPAAPSTGYKIGKLPANVVTISRNKPENSYLQAIQGEPKVLNGPGEYEIAGVLISGVRTEREPAGGKNRNVAFVMDIDDVRICHLGDISEVPNSDDAEALSSADVLLIPVGGGTVFNAQKAAETVSMLEPKLVIPMIYQTDAATAQLDPVDKFLKEMGIEAKPAESRVNITRSTVPASTTISLLNYRG
jgi:L-ascorbate metabolism protein UlaG (beta-lactamase superfamily)